MRRFLVAACAAVVVTGGLAACGSSGNSGGGSPNANGSASAASCTKANLASQLQTAGKLTVATDNPVYPPWFIHNTPTNGKGYESAVAYAIAKQLGFSKSDVTWVKEPFDSSFAPGTKAWDFDINEVSFTPQRAQAVTFSNSYYPVQQAIVARKGTPIVTKHSPAQLKNYLYGDQIGSTGLAFITTKIQPTKQPKVFDTLAQAAAALQAGRIDALITDTPTAQFMASSQLKHAVLVAQFPTVGEHYGLVFEKGNALVTCVNKAIGQLQSDGTLSSLQKKYLGIYLKFPTIQP
ncbi:MAG TPA: ABC transporter substrate-binding protein [Streptosporangiaceae bacterium]|jgi:polar amino acid transport system substrate-binding protein|nr:ABC transporter substrate-binding protein [Streptosporangiaceae bacterium]